MRATEKGTRTYAQMRGKVEVDMEKCGECGLKRKCANCKHLGFMNAGGVDFECAVSACNIRPFGKNLVNASNDVCEKHEFKQCLVIVKDGKFLQKWANYPRVPVFTDNIADAIVYHDWRDAWEMIGDWHRDVLGDCKIRYVAGSGERETFPLNLAKAPDFISHIDNDSMKEVA